MPVKIGTLLNNLAAKAGYDTTLLAVPADSFEIPDELVAALESKLFTEEAAKNNTVLKNHFFKQALDATDKKVASVLEEFGFGDDVKTEIEAIKSTYDRIPALAKKIKELNAKKDDGKGDKGELQAEINRLNQEKAALITAQEGEIFRLKSESQNQITDFLIKSSIQTANLATDQFGKDVMSDLAYNYLQKGLQAKGAKIKNDNGTLKLVQASDEALDYYENNKPVTFDQFKDGVLAQHKLIAVNPPAPAPGTPPPPGTPPARPANPSFQSKIDQALADFALGSQG